MKYRFYQLRKTTPPILRILPLGIPEFKYLNKKLSENFGRFADYIGTGKLDPDTPVEMQNDYFCSKKNSKKYLRKEQFPLP